MNKIPVMMPYFTQEEKDSISAVLDSGWVAQGPKVAEFEQQVAQHEGVAHGIATTSCTTALHLAMVSLGLREGMDVIAPSFTFVATANSIRMTGATPVLADICLETYNMDSGHVRSIIQTQYHPQSDGLYHKLTGNRLWGLVVVHQFGLCADMEEFNLIAKEHGLRIIEDAACAIGAKIGSVHPGGFGNPSCLSFHPRKSITTGEGGMVLTDDTQLAERMRILRSHGASMSADQRHAGRGFLLPEFNEVGYNYRMNDIQAAIGVAQLSKLDWLLSERNRKAAFYTDLIKEQAPFLIPPVIPEGYYHTFQSYVCRLNPNELNQHDMVRLGELRNRILAELEDRGIATRQGTHAVHMLGYYQSTYGYSPEALPNAYAADRTSITLPLYVQMTDEEQRLVISMMKQITAGLV